jgi:Zn-dependent peptidase ImmA (M78 family)
VQQGGVLAVDEMGVPILSGEAIEQRAEHFIRQFDETCLHEPQPTPLGTICTVLKERFGVPFELGVPLGRSARGLKVLGQYHFPSRTISVDETLVDGDPRFLFTLAHEIGHLVLHRKIPLDVIRKIRGEHSRDTKHDLSMDRQADLSSADWLEWQANRFAGAILLPRATVSSALVAIQMQLGINRRLGYVWIDWRNRALGDLNDMAYRLGTLYRVPKAVVKIRLRHVGLLKEENVPKTMNHISDIMDELAREME